VQRGEAWWAQFDEQHPVILLSEGSPFRAVQIVAASGWDVRGLGVEVTVGTRDNLPFEGVVRVAFPRPGFIPCTWVTSVGPDDLVERIGALSTAKLAEVDQALGDGDRINQASDSENEAAQASLAEIRQALRQGGLTTRQIQRPVDTQP
jgi:mRNA interferase MazF